MRIDLHCHTTASDGVLTPTELARLAAQRDIDVIAVTDHDTVAGVEEAVRAGGVRVVAGIELSSRHEGRAVHVLGYFLDPTDAGLLEALDSLRTERLDRVQRMIARLNELGYELTPDEVLAQAKGAIVARPHVARALVERGYVASVREAFTSEFIADGGRADVPYVRVRSPRDALEMISAARGVAVLAHPGLAHHLGTHIPASEALIRDLAGRGLVGLEVDHPDHPPDVRDRLRSMAERLGLVTTGGSDFHGESGRPIAECTTSPNAFVQLEEKARLRIA
jgi:predicted metal-dependent phosphoesterase TrpH